MHGVLTCLQYRQQTAWWWETGSDRNPVRTKHLLMLLVILTKSLLNQILGVHELNTVLLHCTNFCLTFVRVSDNLHTCSCLQLKPNQSLAIQVLHNKWLLLKLKSQVVNLFENLTSVFVLKIK